ncbi:MAPEG family protein [Sphingomonas cannabina]|uniref:MAPEG family protein n=1 Tax=Sphingomonas cannabina TaxID=2899123 RepID=UPI001F2D2B48|nr:MAPEG family protein [Sphingomonas cannabina]UIJ45692.1 MAPEG family protein [Sphingomonas cannabina]
MHVILPVALATAAAAALINLWIGVRVGRLRMAEKVMVGDGGNERLLAGMRAHANFVEYAPFVLILLALVELAAGTSAWLWAASIVFIAGRLLHVFGMEGWRPGRMIGIGATWAVLLGLAVYAAVLPFRSAPPVDATPVEVVPSA